MHALARVFPFVQLLDIANLLTLFNIGLAFIATHLALQGFILPAASVICMAAVLDFLDGHIARQYLAANGAQRAFGKHLDSFADLLNFSITPAIITLALDPSSLATVAAISLVVTAILRLSLFGMPNTASHPGYQGLPTTYSGFVFSLALVGLAYEHYGPEVLTGITIMVAILQVANLRLPKYGALFTVTCFVLLFAFATFYFHS